ncbi:MAG: hypothetical protein NXH74_12420 [Rhodobacteraceae bacterium]|jgi:transcription initiation factor TFIIIB Brf1 subunit/transcription initiation factor TFIIB|nr:hypothetical protein [Paracoccaceae bacterium]
MGHKIATCSYCGTRAALIFDEGRHELVCRACGAPLHEIKSMPQSPDKKRKKYAPGAAERQRTRREVEAEIRGERPAGPSRPRRRKPRKTLGRRVFEELWDVVEDIFD